MYARMYAFTYIDIKNMLACTYIQNMLACTYIHVVFCVYQRRTILSMRMNTYTSKSVSCKYKHVVKRCMCVCTCMYEYVYIHLYIYIYMCIYLSVYINNSCVNPSEISCRRNLLAVEPKLPTELTLYHQRDLYIIHYAYEKHQIMSVRMYAGTHNMDTKNMVAST